MNDPKNLTTVTDMQIVLDVLVDPEMIVHRQKIKLGGQITFKTDSSNTYKLIIPNHDRLFEIDEDIIEIEIEKGKPDTVTIDKNFKISATEGQCVRYYHVFQTNGAVGKYIDIPGNSPPKIVVI